MMMENTMMASLVVGVEYDFPTDVPECDVL